eukprot:COSAG04_NODE_791_length_10285_cov_3.557628_7_plen_150_part_00
MLLSASDSQALAARRNWPLVDVDERNGPMEVSIGSHRYPFPAAHRRIRDGTAPLVRLLMRRGDCVVRDLRILHRGSPNLTETPRPNMMAILQTGEQANVDDGPRVWEYQGVTYINSQRQGLGVPREVLEGMGGRARRLLRGFEVVDAGG